MSSTEANFVLNSKPIGTEDFSEQAPQDSDDNGNGERAKEHYQETVKWIAKQIQDERCILFLGSAIHAQSPTGCTYSYSGSACPPLGDDLSEALATKAGYPYADRDNLPRVALYYESKERFRYRLVEEIKNAVHVDRVPSAALRGLAALRFPIVITTNYDQLYEQALDSVAQTLGGSKAVYEKSVYARNDPDSKKRIKTKDCSPHPSPDEPYLLKIHGDVEDADSIVVTEEDYIQFLLRLQDKHPYHPVGRNLLTHLVNWPTLFVGYRLSDYNLRLLFRSLRVGKAPAEVQPNYSIDLDPDILIRDVWEHQKRYIRFIKKNLWDFVPDLYFQVTGLPMPQ